MSASLDTAVAEHTATKQELDAAMLLFVGAVMRGESSLINARTEAAHAALQAHLDAYASLYAVAVDNARKQT